MHRHRFFDLRRRAATDFCVSGREGEGESEGETGRGTQPVDVGMQAISQPERLFMRVCGSVRT